jgi:serine/threonine-protein phosphatase 5
VFAGGKLVTLFSAPDYPQFIADGEDRYHNKAAVLHLTTPDYATPQVDSFEAVLPRPQVRLRLINQLPATQ